jgi:hypothetical protein
MTMLLATGHAEGPANARYPACERPLPDRSQPCCGGDRCRAVLVDHGARGSRDRRK